MSKFISLFGIQTMVITFALSISHTPFAMAEEKPVEGTADACKAAIDYELGQEQRSLRAEFFGQTYSAKLPVGSVQVDRQKHATWIKTKDNTWKTLSPEYPPDTTWDDNKMNLNQDLYGYYAIIGIFERRKFTTSELIPFTLQAMRAAQCRMRAICMLVTKARDPKNYKTDVKVQPDGCQEFELASIDSCYTTDISAIDTGACDATVDLIIEREMKVLELAISYDAAYRSLLQFSGTFEGFLDDFRFPLLQPLWQMVRALGAMDDLPCFISQCDE